MHHTFDIGLEDVEFNMMMTSYMDFLTCLESSSMPYWLHSPLHSSLLGYVVVAHDANVHLSLYET